MIDRRHRMAKWLGGACFALSLACAPATILGLSLRAAPESFGTRVGPFYVAGFTTRTPKCANDPVCDPAITGPADDFYEVWLFTRRVPGFAERPRVDLLIQLPLRTS
jgi:hypothetical protein